MSLMELYFYPSDFAGKDIASLPDTVVGSAQEMKARFDYVAKEMVALGRFNDLLRLLRDKGGAELGFRSTDAIQADNVQAAIEAVQRQVASAVTGQLPDGSVEGAKLAPGAALVNLAAGSIGGELLAPGAALKNLAEGSITQEKLAPDLKNSLLDRTQMGGWSMIMLNTTVRAGTTASFTLPAQLRGFLTGQGGKLVVKFAPGSYRGAEVELRRRPNGALEAMMTGACAAGSSYTGPRDVWFGRWRDTGSNVFFYDGANDSAMGTCSLVPSGEFYAKDTLSMPRLTETDLVFDFTRAGTGDAHLQAEVVVEVWR